MWSLSLDWANWGEDAALTRLRRAITTDLDRLSELGVLTKEKDTLRTEFGERLLKFPRIFSRLFQSDKRVERQAVYENGKKMCHETLNPDDYPCDMSERVESLYLGLYKIPAARILGTAFVELEKLAKSLLDEKAEAFTFFRLGFEVLRPTDPIHLDHVFDVELSDPPAASRQIQVELSLEKLLTNSSTYKGNLGSISSADYSDGWRLRDRIEDEIDVTKDQWKSFPLGLQLRFRSKMVRREGFRAEFSLEEYPALWSLLCAFAPLKAEETICIVDLKDCYQRRKPRKARDKGNSEVSDGTIRKSLSILNYGGKKNGNQKIRFLDDIGLVARLRPGRLVESRKDEASGNSIVSSPEEGVED